MEQSGVLTPNEIRQIPCRFCHSPSGHYCKGTISFHRARIEMALRNKEAKILGHKLTPGEKSIAVYYAFIQLCDAVSANSQAVLGGQFTSQQIQAFFVGTAIKEAEKDQLIEPFDTGTTSQVKH